MKETRTAGITAPAVTTTLFTKYRRKSDSTTIR